MMKWIEGWYSSYALLGVAAAGLLPILLPLEVERTADASQLGIVLAAFSFGGLTAPLWGRLADSHRLHRALLAGGLACTAVGAAAFPFLSLFPLRIALALLLGIGIAAASTTANLFVIEAHPQAEWDARIGWLQTFYGVGQVAGLLLAGILAQGSLRAGLLAVGALSAIAIFPALLLAPRLAGGPLSRRPALTHAVRHAEWPTGSPQRMYHHATVRAVRLLGSSRGVLFALFLFGWFLSYGGSTAFFSLYPVVMQKGFGVAPGLSSIGFAVSAGIGLLLYAPAGRWSAGGRSVIVLRAGIAVRLVAFLVLWLLALSPRLPQGWPAQGLFLLVVLAWSALSVASTTLAAEMNSGAGSEGEGIGLFNAVSALSGVVGSAAAGWTAATWGFRAIPAVAVAGSAAGLLIMLVGKFRGRFK